MTAKRRQLYVLGSLLAVLAIVVYVQYSRSPEFATVFTPGQRYEPLKVQDPSLKLDLLERISKLEYTGTQRNIFSPEVPPPPPTAEQIAAQQQAARQALPVPTGPTPLQPSLTYYGYVDYVAGGRRRGFFLNGEDIFIASEGQTVMNRFRVVRLGDGMAEVEELATGRRAALPMEAPPLLGAG